MTLLSASAHYCSCAFRYCRTCASGQYANYGPIKYCLYLITYACIFHGSVHEDDNKTYLLPPTPRMLVIDGKYTHQYDSESDAVSQPGRSITSDQTMFVPRVWPFADTEELLLNQPRSDWKSDINHNRSQEWYGSMTFAYWLPDY